MTDPLHQSWRVPRDERLNELTEQGNEHFAYGRFALAVDCYNTGLLAIATRPTSLGFDDDICTGTLYMNRAACQLKLGHYSDAHESASECLRRFPRYPKALISRARACIGLGHEGGAARDVQALMLVEPHNNDEWPYEVLLLMKEMEAMGKNIAVPKASPGFVKQLHVAVYRDKLEVLKNLLKHADVIVDETDGERSFTPLMLAVARTAFTMSPFEHQLEMTRLLLRHGADMFLPDCYGETPMMYAVGSGQHEMVRLLLEHGYPVDEPDHLGKTAIMFAIGNNDTAVMRVFLDAGASLTTKLPVEHMGTVEDMGLEGSPESAELIREEIQKRATVPSLLDMCHKNIRKQLGSRGLHPKIERLKLPKKLHRYLKKLTC